VKRFLVRLQLGISAILFLTNIFPQGSNADVRSDADKYWSYLNVRVLRDLPYSVSQSSASCRLDLYLPPSSQALPLIVCIHGGGWGAGDKWMFPLYLLPRHGYAVASINYRLSTEAPFPAQIEDCRAAIYWLVKNASTYGLDEKRIGLWGSSAGGHLAALIGLGYGERRSSDMRPKIKAVCDWCGPSNLVTICDQYQGKAANYRPRMKLSIRCLLRARAGNYAKLARQASPTTYVNKRAPAFLLMHGKLDQVVPVAQSIDFSRKLRSRGVDCTLVVLPKEGHDFYSLAREVQVIQFFDRELKVAETGATNVSTSEKR